MKTIFFYLLFVMALAINGQAPNIITQLEGQVEQEFPGWDKAATITEESTISVIWRDKEEPEDQFLIVTIFSTPSVSEAKTMLNDILSTLPVTLSQTDGIGDETYISRSPVAARTTVFFRTGKLAVQVSAGLEKIADDYARFILQLSGEG